MVSAWYAGAVPGAQCGRCAASRAASGRVSVELVIVEPAVDPEQAGLMAEQLAHRHRSLAALGELGPQGSDGRIQIDQAVAHQAGDHDTGGPFRTREDREQLVGLGARTPPQVEYAPAVVVDAQRPRVTGVGYDGLPQPIGHRFEARLHRSPNALSLHSRRHALFVLRGGSPATGTSSSGAT